MASEYDKKQFVAKKINAFYKKKYVKSNINKKLAEKHIDNCRGGGFSKIYECITKRIYKVFVKNILKFDVSYLEIIGCTVDELEKHITDQFEFGMTIDNHGEWEIDHILPVSSFDFSIKENIFKCFHYSNLQPLWFEKNRKKFDHIIDV